MTTGKKLNMNMLEHSQVNMSFYNRRRISNHSESLSFLLRVYKDGVVVLHQPKTDGTLTQTDYSIKS